MSAPRPLLPSAPACLYAGTLTCLRALHAQTLKDVKEVAQGEKVRAPRRGLAWKTISGGGWEHRHGAQTRRSDTALNFTARLLGLGAMQ